MLYFFRCLTINVWGCPWLKWKDLICDWVHTWIVVSSVVYIAHGVVLNCHTQFQTASHTELAMLPTWKRYGGYSPRDGLKDRVVLRTNLDRHKRTVNYTNSLTYSPPHTHTHTGRKSRNLVLSLGMTWDWHEIDWTLTSMKTHKTATAWGTSMITVLTFVKGLTAWKICI